MKNITSPTLFGFLLFCLLTVGLAAQDLNFERSRHGEMLRIIKDDIKRNYFDPSLKGIDIEGKYKLADEKMKQALSIGQMSGIIAQFMADFDDSHLFFIPPQKAARTDYGFEMKMVDTRCYVSNLDPKSDAAAKGLEIGDEINSIEGLKPLRANLWKIDYLFFRLRPRLQLKLTVTKPEGKSLDLDIASKVTAGRKVLDMRGQDINQVMRDQDDEYYKSVKQYFYDKIPGIFAWKMPSFSLDAEQVDRIIDRAKKDDVILDLRGNSGGRVDMLLRLIGGVFPADVKVYEEKSRKETKEITARSKKSNSITGKLIVLIDSESASASELFARVVQIEKRGTIIGDRSAGAVMESMMFGHEHGIEVVVFYGASITVADLIMKDGKSLEKVGVTPDETLVPSQKDMVTGRDVVLSRAFQLLGHTMSPEDAGKIFPHIYEKRR